VQHDVVTELFYDGEWRTAPVYSRGGVELSRGAGGEDDEAPPSTAGLTLDNRTGDYSPRNANSPLFGVAGRNTPLRVSTATAQDSVSDTFTRSVTDDWGTATSGEAWTLTGVGGALFSDFQVTGSTGTMAVSQNSAYRLAYLPDVSFVDCEAYGECTVALATGGTLEPTLVLRLLDDTTYYMVRASLYPDSAEIDVVIRKIVGGDDTLVAEQVIVGTHVAANPIKVRARIVGMTIQAKAWQGSSEPDWQLTATDGDISGVGGVGLRAGIGSGNTNAKPVTFGFDNFAVTPVNVRSVVEVSSWAPHRNANDTDRWTEIQGGGILRRLGQGDLPQRSTAYKAYMSPVNDATRIDYWPLEEESGSGSIASPVGSPTMEFGDVDFGAYTDSPSAARMVTFGANGFLRSAIRPYTSTFHRVQALVTLPDAGLADLAVIYRIHCTGGNIAWLDLLYGLPNGLYLRAFNSSGTQLDQSGPWGPFSIDGNHFLLGLDLEQDGADLDTRMFTSFADDSAWLNAPDTFTGLTVGRMTNWRIGQTSIEGASVGHAVVGNDITAFSNFTATEGGVVGLQGYRGETCGARFARVAEEIGLPAYVYGDPTDTQLMGPQPVATAFDILAECVRTDDGQMFEARNARAVVMRTGRSRYNQDPALELDFEGGQISEGIAPALDDRHTRNDITANRQGGSSARAVRETGPLNVNDPIDDPEGVGRYDTTVDVNPDEDSTLVQHAYWHLHRGTVDEPRYPEVTVDLDRAPDLRAAVDNVEIGDRIAITNMPTDWQQDPGSLLVLGVRESYPPGTAGRRRTVTFVTIPASQFEIGIVGAEDGSVDLRGQAIDTDASTLAAAIDSDDTSLSVASSDDVLWTTNADSWDTGLHGSGTYGAGLFLRIAGEVMRVTNIASAVTDAFGRTSASSWGSADSGQAWTVIGTASQYAVGSGTGQITPSALTADRGVTLTADAGADRIVQCDMRYPALPASGLLLMGLFSRFVDSSNFIHAQIRISSAGAVTVRLAERVAGTLSTIADFTHPTAYVGNTWWRMIIESRGTTHKVRAWPVFDADDPGWQINTTDTSIPAGTLAGCFARNETAVTTHVAHFDSFAVTNPQTITVVRSVNDVVKSHTAGTAVHVAHPVRIGL
jgi:hypothetical protein